MATKKFDAVQLMRQARDRMGADMDGMSFDEQKAYIQQHASKVRKDLEIREVDGETSREPERSPRKQLSTP